MGEYDEWNLPDFSRLQEVLSSIQEIVRPISEGMQTLQQIIRPISEIVEEYRPKIVAGSQIILQIGRRLKAIDYLGEAQFVQWDYMSQEFVDDIVDAPNVNAMLRQHMIRDHYRKVDETITRTIETEQIAPFRRLYIQAVDSFRGNNADLAVVGFTAVFDGLLSEVSNDTTPGFKKRIDVIKEKMDDNITLSHEEVVMITLALTLEKTLDKFSAYSDFKHKEPKGLNRHWIAHGRTRRRKTKLDCVKMINLLYGLILVSNLEHEV